MTTLTADQINSLNQISIADFDSSHEIKSYVVNYGDRYFRVSENYASLISAVKFRPNNLASACAHFRQSNGGAELSIEAFEKLVQARIEPLLNASTSVPSSKKTLTLSYELVGSKVLGPVTRLIGVLFQPTVLLWVSCVAVIVNLTYVVYGGATENATLGLESPTGLLMNVLVVTFCFFLHELGHLSACKYFGANHGGLGVGMYLHIPVLYADVSAIWLLKRQERMMVNFGGVYVQIICASIFAILDVHYFHGVIAVAVLYNYLAIIANMNPLFKFDGYWIFSDWLGVPNLRALSVKALQRFLFGGKERVNARNEQGNQAFAKIDESKIKYLTIYMVCSTVFFAYVFLYALPRGIFNYVWVELSSFIKVVSTTNAFADLDIYYLFSLGFKTLLFFVYLYILSRCIRGILRRYKLIHVQ